MERSIVLGPMLAKSLTGIQDFADAFFSTISHKSTWEDAICRRVTHVKCILSWNLKERHAVSSEIQK